MADEIKKEEGIEQKPPEMTEKELFAQMFFQLVVSLHHAAFYQMGKELNPITGKMDRDLFQSRISIDMLRMLRDRTAGNIAEEEKDMLTKIIFDLEMNYVEEAKKGVIIPG